MNELVRSGAARREGACSSTFRHDAGRLRHISITTGPPFWMARWYAGRACMRAQ